MCTTLSVKSRVAAMSLVEVLLVIVVIASITAITVPMLGNLKDQATTNSARRTAQIVASTAENARIAGDLSIPSATTKQEAIDLLSSGVLGSGVFEGVEYKVHLNEKQRVAVLPFLDFERGSLVYDGNSEID